MKLSNAHSSFLSFRFSSGLYFVLATFSLVFLLFFVPNFASAATLYFSPSSGSHNVGNTFSVSVFVSSSDQAMNAVSGVVSYPKDLLQVTSLSKTGSIMSLWVQEPSFSNSDGTVNFEGVVLNPGFIGSSGKIITLTFRVKSTGVAPISFTTSSVLANDGKGTNILSTIGTASFNLNDSADEPTQTTAPTQQLDISTPRISSPTHPDQNTWYSKRDAEFVWDVPDGVTKVRILYNKVALSEPTVAYEPPISRKVVTDISDGVWYFHVRNETGTKRGTSGHFKFQIDTEKPDYFDIREITRTDKTEPAVKFIFDARDRTSGIENFEVKIDDNVAQVWKYTSDSTFTTKTLTPGKHTLTAKAYDKAGNFMEDSVEFEVESLKAPVFTEIPREIEKGDSLTIRGSTEYPDSNVVIMYQKDGEDKVAQVIAKTDENGNFSETISGGEFTRGNYSVWGKVSDKRGAQSANSEKQKVTIVSAGFLRIGGILISYLSVFLMLLLLIIVAVISVMYAWYKIASLKRKIREEREGAIKGVEKAFMALRDEVKQQVAMLDDDKRINESERRIYERLRSALKIAESFVSKKVKNIDGEDD